MGGRWYRGAGAGAKDKRKKHLEDEAKKPNRVLIDEGERRTGGKEDCHDHVISLTGILEPAYET